MTSPTRPGRGRLTLTSTRVAGGVWRATLSRMFASAVSRKTASTRTSGGSSACVDRDRPRLERLPRSTDGSVDEHGEVMDLDIGRQRAGADPAQVQDRADQPVETLDLGVDRLGAGADLRPASTRTPGRRGSRPSPGCWRAAFGGRGTRSRARALLNASLRRATSARTASSRRRSRRRASAIWSAASAINRVPAASRPVVGRLVEPRSEPISTPAVSILTRMTLAGRPPAVAADAAVPAVPAVGDAPAPAEPDEAPSRRALGSWALTQCAGSSPGIRTSVVTTGVAGNGPDPESAIVRVVSGRFERHPDAVQRYITGQPLGDHRAGSTRSTRRSRSAG